MINVKMTDIKIGDLTKKDFKLNYSNVKKAIMSCELDKQSQECKKMLKDLNIEVYD